MTGLPATEEPADGLPSRAAALSILAAILDHKQPLDQALDGNPDFNALPRRDRNFARMLATTALRHLGQLDDIILKATRRDEPLTPPSLHHILRLGVTQIAFMSAPDYAVVDTCVRLAESIGLGRQKGLVNAALRNAARNARQWLEGQNAAQLNFPAWLLKDWTASYGADTAIAIAQASLAEAPLDITLKDPSAAINWANLLEATLLPTGTLRRNEGGSVQDLPGFDDGDWWIQDAAAAIPARLFGDLKNRSVLDLCAAPGGKTAQLAASGATVHALDRSAQRLKRLTENMARLKLEDRVTTEVADAGNWHPKSPPTHILLDAPCTATGTIRRHPDILHLKTPRDMDRLAETQKRLLDHAAAMLAPGGLLVYCTCSLQKGEGEFQIDALLARDKSVTRLPVTAAETGGLSDLITPDGDIRILPFHLAPLGGMDGFYAARLRKS